MHGALELTQEIDISIIDEPVRWRALDVQSGKERQACIWLRMRQFQPYWPRYRSENRIHANRKNIRWKSVIPGYVFLPIPSNIVFLPIHPASAGSDFFRFAPGIRGFMRNGSGNIVELRSADIDQIKDIEEALQSSIIAAEQGIPFKVGQKVRIVKPGIEAKIVEITSKRRIIVEAQFLGALRQWTLAGSEIEAI